MATLNFMYRSKKENEPLNVRLLFRHNNIDYSQGVKTQLLIFTNDELMENSKLSGKFYWKNQHKKKSKDIDISNKQIEINNEINRISNFVLKQFNSQTTEQIVKNKDWLKNIIYNYYNPPEKEKTLTNNLIEYFDFFLKQKEKDVVERTLKNYRVVKQQLIKLQKEIDSPILIKDVNLQFKDTLQDFYEQNGYSLNTIAKGLRTIKTVCGHAKINGIETSHQLDAIKIKSHKVEKIYLTFEELEVIENLDKTQLSESLENARDWLIISCFSGQRISDFLNFNTKQIRTENGKTLIEFTQQKTSKNMTVPLHEKILSILKKRNNEFPRTISDQRYNDYIKEICKIAGLNQKIKGSIMAETIEGSKIYRKKEGLYEKWELVTSHIGRRSFATNYYGQIPTTFLIYITGHSTEKMFLNYIGKSNKDLAIEITNYF